MGKRIHHYPFRLRPGKLAAAEALLTLAVVAIVGLIGYGVFYVFDQSQKIAAPSANTSASSFSAPPSGDSYAVLAPATVPSKTPECSQALTYTADGDSGPVTCANGDLNVTEWKALATLEPKVMTLGYSPSLAQV